MSSRNLKRPHLENVEKCSFAMDITKFLEDGSFASHLTELEKTHIRKRAANCCLLDGVLHHGIRRPKPVLSDQTHQLDALTKHHVVAHGQRHRNARETLSSIRKEFFWQDLSQSVVDFVEKCSICQHYQADQDKENSESLLASKVWKKVCVTAHGPYNFPGGEVKSVLVLQDPVSKWQSASVVANDDNFSQRAATFIFSTFCQYGFANCNLQRSTNSKKIIEHFTKMWNALAIEGIQADQIMEECDFVDKNNSNEEIDDFVATCMSNHFEDFEMQLNIWLFRQRISEAEHGRTVFSVMYNRDPLAISRIEEKTLASGPGTCSLKRRRKLKSSFLSCRHCDDVFTSRISFQLHQKMHLERAKKRGVLEGECLSKIGTQSDIDDGETENIFLKRRSKIAVSKRIDKSARIARLAATNCSKGIKCNPDEVLDESQVKTMTTSSVSAVKALLAATREERTKRGRYVKYTPELRDEIAEYALKNGIPDACDYYSGQMDNVVTASTVRNFMKSYDLHAPELKEEIGKFAYQFGLEKCAQEYHVRNPSLELNRNLIKRFKSYFLRKFPHLPCDEDDDLMVIEGTKNKAAYNPELRNDIGRFAFHCGNSEAVKHFSAKLQFPMKESTVRKFRKVWMESNQISQLPEPQAVQQQIITVQMPPVVSTHDTVEVGVINGHVVQAGAHLIQASGFQQFQQPSQQHATLILNPTSVGQIVPVSQFSQQHSQIVLQPAQPQLQYQQYTYVTTQEQNSVPLSLTVSTIAAPEQQQLVNLSSTAFNIELPTHSCNVAATVSHKDDLGETLDVHGQSELDCDSESSEKDISSKNRIHRIVSRKVKKRRGTKINTRGKYANYCPELRAQIGKFATDHSNQETINYFLKEHKIDLPESTVRGLRDKYLMQCKENGTEYNQVSELDFGPRGRPMRLGKYDTVVKNCIMELVAAGEKMSSFLVIATAKQVLMQNEPSRLVEFGGKVNLNPTWAKSFLKRIEVKTKQTKN